MSDQTRKLAAIVFTDLAGFSELSSSDENLAIELVNTQHEIIQPLIETYNGVLHKKTGDGFLLTFPTATSAIEFSIDFQRAVKHVDGLNIRIGIHEGEITVQNDDVFGDDVNIAARIESYSPVGGIAISEKVKLELGSLPEYETAFIGEPELKGIKQPVKIYCISSHGLVSPYNKVDDSLISEQKKGFRFNVLSLTGIVLMIIGGIFWAWYGFGNITHGSDDDLAGGIKKSIAVINFQNLSGEKAGDHYCSAISEYIRSVLIKLGKLDVKRLASKNNEPNDLGLDYYIEGTLAEIEGKRNIYVYLVDAKSKSYLRTFPYQLVDEQILAYQDTIIKNILIELNIDPSENELISNKSEYGTVENFKLIGEGLLNFDNKNYIVAMEAFDSVLESNPKNMIANFHKANTYFELNKNDDAMNIYKDILSHTINIDPIQWHMPVPERNDMHPILCDNIELIEDKKLAIMLLKGNNGSRLMCINTATKDFVWEKPINDQFVSSPVIINNTVFLSSSRFKKEQIGEPTLFAFDISNGRQIFVREFPRDNPNQTVLFNIYEEYSNISDNSSTILLTFDKLGLANESQKELVLIETAEGSTVWESKIEGGWGFWAHLMLINTKSTELLILILENDVVALNNKTGREMWRENFSGSGISAWNKKILRINPNEKYVAIWDPISRKDVWHYEHEFVYALNMDDIMYSFEEFRGRMNRDVVLLNFNNGNLIAVNYDGGIFNWNRERWTINVGYAEKIWFPEKMSNHIFCLTEDNLLFTINMSDGKIINSFATDGHDYNVYFDDSQNAMVLHNSEFLIGVDPLNGNQLWKIKDNGVDQARLVGNTILAAKTKLEDNLLLINAYNRDNGNLIWNKNINISASLDYLPKIGPMCGVTNCAFCSNFNFFLEQYSDKSLFLVLHDEIIKMGAMQDKGVAVRQKDVRLQIAKTHEKRGELDAAIEEYKLLLFQDQMNPFAHWELANIYQKKNKVNEAAKSLINYYDLIFPESFEGTRTIQKLKDLNILKWNKNISRNKSDAANMDVDREKIFLFINNNIESHSIHSSSLIWENSFGDKNTSVVSTDVKNEKHIFFIKKDVPDAKMFYFQEMLTNKRLDFEAYDKASKYSIAAMDKRDGKISWDLPLEIPGESNITWMGVKSNKIFIQSIASNKMSVSAHDVKSGTLIWKISRDITSFYKSYYLTPAFYKDLLLLPLATSIEYINAENGNAEGKYFDNDIDHIFSFNENSIQNNTMKFFIVEFENEYVEVDLEKNVKISGGVLDSDHPERGMWINNMFVDVSSSGSVAAYKLSTDTGGEALELWKYNYNSTLRLVGFDEQNISILDLDSERIIVVDAQSGTNLQSKPLLWPGEIVKMTGNYYIVQSENNLFVVPM